MLKSIVTTAMLRPIARLIVLDALKKEANAMAARAHFWAPGLSNEANVAKYRAASGKYNRMKFFWMKKLPAFPQFRG